MPTNPSPTSENADDRTARPFTTFNFRVRIRRDGTELCDAAFSECDGLEATMEPKTHREGGNNDTQYQLVGPVSYGQLTLKRGMTKTFGLWDWFNRVNEPDGYGARTHVRVEVLSSDREGDGESQSAVDARFILSNCLPVKLRAPSLSASEGGVAIEEMQIAYEHLRTEIPGTDSEMQSPAIG